MLGDTFIGKTSLALRFAKGYYREAARNPTVGAFFVTKRLTVQGVTCKIQIWDTAGQEQFRKLAPMYYKNAHCAIICYDITSPRTYETLQYWIQELHDHAPGDLVIALCATKSDLVTNPDTSQVEELAEATGAMFFSTSAKDDTNVNLVFEKVAERILQMKMENPERFNPVTPANSVHSGFFAVNTPKSAPSSPKQSFNVPSDSHGVRDEKKDSDGDGMVRDQSNQNTQQKTEPSGGCDGFLCGEMLDDGDTSNCVIQ